MDFPPHTGLCQQDSGGKPVRWIKDFSCLRMMDAVEDESLRL